MGSRKVMIIMIILATVTVLWAPSTDAQNAPSCIQALMSWAQYINATNPPALRLHVFVPFLTTPALRRLLMLIRLELWSFLPNVVSSRMLMIPTFE